MVRFQWDRQLHHTAPPGAPSHTRTPIILTLRRSDGGRGPPLNRICASLSLDVIVTAITSFPIVFQSVARPASPTTGVLLDGLPAVCVTLCVSDHPSPVT